MVIGIVSKLIYIQDKMNHTVYYSESANNICKIVNENYSKQTFENIKAFIARTENELVQKISQQLIDLLNTNSWTKLNPKDFRFVISLSDVDKDGSFWLIPYSSLCKEYKIIP